MTNPPAVTELSLLDAEGKEFYKASRLAMDVVGSGTDYSKEAKFTETVAKKIYYGPVYLRRESEPYMTLGLANTRSDAGASVVELNLTLMWDIVQQTKIGDRGVAYVLNAEGRHRASRFRAAQVSAGAWRRSRSASNSGSSEWHVQSS